MNAWMNVYARATSVELTLRFKKKSLREQLKKPSVWRQSTHKMAAQLVVAMIIALKRNCRIAWSVAFAPDWVLNIQSMSRRTRVTTRRWPRKKKKLAFCVTGGYLFFHSVKWLWQNPKYSVWLFVSLFVCLFVCVFVCLFLFCEERW